MMIFGALANTFARVGAEFEVSRAPDRALDNPRRVSIAMTDLMSLAVKSHMV